MRVYMHEVRAHFCSYITGFLHVPLAFSVLEKKVHRRNVEAMANLLLLSPREDPTQKYNKFKGDVMDISKPMLIDAGVFKKIPPRARYVSARCTF